MAQEAARCGPGRAHLQSLGSGWAADPASSLLSSSSRMLQNTAFCGAFNCGAQMLPREDPGLLTDVFASPRSILNELLHSEQTTALSKPQGNQVVSHTSPRFTQPSAAGWSTTLSLMLGTFPGDPPPSGFWGRWALAPPGPFCALPQPPGCPSTCLHWCSRDSPLLHPETQVEAICFGGILTLRKPIYKSELDSWVAR